MALFFILIRIKESQKQLAESHELTSSFVLDTRHTLTGPNRYHDFIINLNQTLIPFSLHRKWSLDIHGTCMIDTHKSTGDTRHATLTVMVTASGRIFLPFLVFKGRPGDHI